MKRHQQTVHKNDEQRNPKQRCETRTYVYSTMGRLKFHQEPEKTKDGEYDIWLLSNYSNELLDDVMTWHLIYQYEESNIYMRLNV